MFSTEEEAKKKSCPMYAKKSKCIASECMAWRLKASFKAKNRGRGYCGLAGKPVT